MVPGSRPQDDGEQLVVAHLRDALPDTYTLIPNIEIYDNGRPPFEYDLVVIAPHGVYVVEVKRWRGGIRGDDDTWVVGGQHYRPNPWKTANQKARVLKSQIQRLQPACEDVWVEAVVAIADAGGELSFKGQCRDRVFRYTDLPAFLMDPAVLGGRGGDWRPQRAYLESAVRTAAVGRSSRPLAFGSYEVLETLARRDRDAEYLARHTQLQEDQPYRLRVFSYDPYLPQPELEQRAAQIRRESEALRRIGPHPNLIVFRSFDAAPEDPNLFVEVTDWSEQGTLRTLLSSGNPLSMERKLELAQGIAQGLKAAHDASVIHRDLRPENVLIGSDGSPRLMNFDYARLGASGARTLAQAPRDPAVPRAYLAPELLNPAVTAVPAADLYALGVILFEMLVGQPLFASPEEAQAQSGAAGGPTTWGALDVPPQLNDLVRRLTKIKPAERPQSADEVLAELQTIRKRPSGTVDEPPPPAPSPAPQVEMDPSRFVVGDIIDHKYQVQAALAAGGSGQVYRVYDGIFDRIYALKVFNDTAMSLDWLKQEARPLLEMDHPNIVKVHTWGQLNSGRLYLVSEYVDGEDLVKYTDGSKRMPVRQAVDCAIQLLSALEYIHPEVDRLADLEGRQDELEPDEYNEWMRLKESGWLHRDIKPANLMLSDETLKLIDFNIAAKARQASRTYTGTPGYMLPDTGMARWDASCDLFATGIVLYELITGRHPYPDRCPNAEDSPANPQLYVENLAPQLAGLLLRAVSVDRAVRYRSARRFRQDLQALDGLYLIETPVPPAAVQIQLAPDELGRPDYNPYVTRFLTSYSQARRDNSGTRGLDDVAKLTYVDTLLDTALRPAILDGQYQLVIITGNAGDGKTAFVKNLENEVVRQGGEVEAIGANASTFQHRGRLFQTNYDGSQDEGAERANDQVLTEFFTPFRDGESPDEGRVLLIAINEGRLIDFFGGSVGREQFSTLGRHVLDFFSEERTELPPALLIVDLNRRSVVAQPRGEAGTSIFERQLLKFLLPAYWTPCEGCRWRMRCPIKYNADTLSDPVSGPAVAERLRRLFEVVHLRRQLHITMRDLRSALSWLIFRDHSCADVAELLTRELRPADLLTLLYVNAFASDGAPPPGRSDDRLVALLRQIDPAETANPGADRELHFRGPAGLPMLAFEKRSSLETEPLALWRDSLRNGWEALQSPEALAERRTYHGLLRRIGYFERRDDAWQAMLPYRHLEDFLRAVVEPDQLDSLKATLIRGLSAVEGARNEEFASKYVCLRAGQEPKARIKSFRLFPAADFRAEIARANGASVRYVEYTPDRLILYHQPQDPSQQRRGARRAELQVSLDVLELLAEMKAGFVPSPNDIQGYFVNLVIFKNALAHLPFRQLLLTRDDQEFYELGLEGNAVARLRRLEKERANA